MGIKEALISLGELPWQHSVITLRDGQELCVENCTAVVSCTDSCEKSGEIVIRIRCAGQERLLRICGGELMLESFGTYGVRILGNIETLSFVQL